MEKAILAVRSFVCDSHGRQREALTLAPNKKNRNMFQGKDAAPNDILPVSLGPTSLQVMWFPFMAHFLGSVEIAGQE